MKIIGTEDALLRLVDLYAPVFSLIALMVYIIIVLLLLLGIKKSMLSRPWSCSKVRFNFATRPLFATQASVAEISTVTETAAPAGKSPCNLAAIASGEKPPQKVKETRVSSVFFLSAQTGPRSGQ